MRNKETDGRHSPREMSPDSNKGGISEWISNIVKIVKNSVMGFFSKISKFLNGGDKSEAKASPETPAKESSETVTKTTASTEAKVDDIASKAKAHVDAGKKLVTNSQRSVEMPRAERRAAAESVRPRAGRS